MLKRVPCKSDLAETKPWSNLTTEDEEEEEEEEEEEKEKPEAEGEEGEGREQIGTSPADHRRACESNAIWPSERSIMISRRLQTQKNNGRFDLILKKMAPPRFSSISLGARSSSFWS
ncbi:MAG: hypothetical protein Q8P67_18050 [archaeon]|nr:hypothetical protein [archaeon]